MIISFKFQGLDISLKVFRFLLFGTFIVAVLYGGYFRLMHLTLDRIDEISKSIRVKKPTNPEEYSAYNTLVFHGLSGTGAHVMGIVEHMQDAFAPILLYHGDTLKELGMIDTKQIMDQIEKATHSMMKNKSVGYLVTHSYSALLAISLSLDGRFPSGLKLILIAPAIELAHAKAISLLLKFGRKIHKESKSAIHFSDYHIILRGKNSYSKLWNLMWKTKFLTDKSPASAELCLEFLEQHNIFTSHGLTQTIQLGEEVKNKLLSGRKMQNEFALILSGKDMQVSNEIGQNILSKSELCKYYKVVPDAPHQPYLSRKVSVRRDFFESLSEAVNCLKE